jgi:Trk K+ transport system NAD-binding subunit
LAHRLVEELVNRYTRRVTVILPSRRRNHGPQIARLPRVRIVEAERLDSDAFRRARADDADAVALVHQDDVGNIHAALQAQELNAGIRLVIRMFNMSLGLGIRALLRDCTVLSDAAMAAPAFVSAALGEVAPVHVRLPDRTLYVAHRGEVADDQVVCGLAAMSSERPELLPSDADSADLVLAVAPHSNTGAPSGWPSDLPDELAMPMPRGRRARHWWARTRRHPLRAVRLLLDRKLVVGALVLIVLLLFGTGLLAAIRDLPWWDAAYLTVLTALGGASPDVGVGPAEKIIQTALTIVSIALIPVITAAVVEAAVNARLAIALGRLVEPIEDHVIVVGLGNVGTRVIRQLRTRGIPMVAIDRAETARGVQLARQLQIPLIIGDASREETLRAASVRTCRALVVLSTDDLTNLEAALHGRTLQPHLRVVLRLFDGDFADRIQRAFGITLSRSVSYLAAPAFAAAMLEREVIGTIPVGRRVLLIADVPVCTGSALEGMPLAAARALPDVQVIAVSTDGAMMWTPPSPHILRAGDRVIVVASRAGLGRILAL